MIGQSNAKRERRIQTEGRIELDSTTVLAHSIELNDTFGRPLQIDFHLEDNFIVFHHKKQNIPSVIDIKYHVLPFHLGDIKQLIDTTNLSSKKEGLESFYDYKIKNKNPKSLFGTKGLDYDGSFSRGISFGNAQNLIYDAAFNLQMAGTIGDNISLKAAISDNQIPIQPEGNTQQIQEFDRIFIEIAKDRHSLLAGDFNILPSKGYFMKYNKKLKGLSYAYHADKNASLNISSRTSAAIARGRFNRQSLNVREGNQGPYKLLGKQGERFIIIIAGSEKVYIDGILIKRGKNHDYVMDYNLGEVSFTTNMPITTNSRVFVEFEYLDQQYSRTILTQENTLIWKNITSFINIYNQQDSKRPSVNFGTELDSTTLSSLENLSETTGKLFVPGTRKTLESSNEQEVKYEMRDTFYRVNGIRVDTSILFHQKQSTSSDLYTSKFSELGSKVGDYIIKQSTLNGRIYEWVAPDSITGIPNGNYAPVISITPPSTHQVIESGIQIKFSPQLSFSTEIAVSRKDLNRYSTKFKENDVGSALRSNLKFKRKLSKYWNFDADLEYEYKHQNFTIIEPFRDSEFKRNWNIDDASPQSEHLPKLLISLAQNNGNTINYRYNGLYRSDNYRGNQHSWSGSYGSKGWKLQSTGSVLNNRNALENSSFFKPSVNLQKRFKNLQNTAFGIIGELEQNQRRDVTSDTLLASSFYFYEMSPYIENELNKKLKFTLKYTFRIDKVGRSNQMAPLSKAKNFIFSSYWKPNNKTNIKSSFNYRSFLVNQEYGEDLKDTKTLLGKTILSTQLFNGSLRWITRYEVSSGQEPKSEFVFTEVQSGQGNYIFSDFNQDGVAQFNEYILAPYTDTANYLKLRLFNNEFIRTDHVVLEQSVVFDPRKAMLKRKKKLPLWYNWMIRSTYKSSKKTTAASISDAWNPLSTGINDSNLIIDFTLLNALLIFRPSDDIYDVQFKHSQRKTKQILTTGYESQRSSDYIGSLRWNLIKQLDVRMEIGRRYQWSDSENFDDRDYNILQNKFKTLVNYRWKTKLRFGLGYEIEIKDNAGMENIDAQIQNLKFETTIKQSTKHSLNFNLTYAQVKYGGNVGTALELIMLNGLKPGGNYIWNVRYDRKLTAAVFMNISYNGRKTGEARIFHTGNIQMRAIF